MGKPFNVHPSDDQLDFYLVGHLSPEDARLIEEHYLGCPVCLDRLSSVTDFIAVLRTAVQAYSPQPSLLPSIGTILRKPARFAAMLTIAAGTALVCSAPSPSLELHSTFDSLNSPQRLEIPQAVRRRARPRIQARHFRPLHVFEPPPLPLTTLFAPRMIEIPNDLIIPTEWLSEPISALTAAQLEPPPLPPFQAKPRWFRRVIAAVKRVLENDLRAKL